VNFQQKKIDDEDDDEKQEYELKRQQFYQHYRDDLANREENLAQQRQNITKMPM